MEFVIFRVILPAFLAITALSVRTTSAPALQNNRLTIELGTHLDLNPFVVEVNSQGGKQLNLATHPDEAKRLSWDRAAGLKEPGAAWPNAVIPYTISEDFDEDHNNLIKKAMNLISQKTCITFPEFTNESDYVRIEKGTTCQSFTGRVGGSQVLLLKTPGCGDHIGVVLHEILHALGLIHEQSRPDRDSYIKIEWENIIDDPDALSNFDEYDWDTVQNLTVPYDLASVMQYNKYVYSKNGNMTIIPKNNGTIPDYVYDLSASDAKFLNLMYCNITASRSQGSQ